MISPQLWQALVSLVEDFAVRVRGQGGRTYLLAHGLGGSQRQWEAVAESLAEHARVVTFDLAGFGDSNPETFDSRRHSDLFGYADDLVALCDELQLRGCTFVGHSISGMIGLLAAAAEPQLFDLLVVVAANPRYLEEPESGYHGGFSEDDVARTLEAIREDFALWAAGFAPLAMQNADRPLLTEELQAGLAACPPDVALTVFQAALVGDYRRYISRVQQPTLVVQAQSDPAVPISVGRWLADTLPHGLLRVVDSTGHFPHVADPQQLLVAIEDFVSRYPATGGSA